MAEITNVSKLIINYLTEEQYQTAKASDLINENELYIESTQTLLGVAHPAAARFVIGTSTAGWSEKDCDYLCDGTADQVEINNAIQALPATGGEIIILDGTYNIAAKIDVTKDNVSIRGNGNSTILKRMFNSSVAEGVITLSSRSGCKIANLQVDGNRVSYTNPNNYGIYLESSTNNTVTGNTCNNNTSGIYLESSSNNNTITGNTCNNNINHGIHLYDSINNTITDNTCNNNTDSYGIYLESSTNNTVTGNTCNNNYLSGIRLTDSSNNNTITGNTCNNNINHGILLYNSTNNTVTGNTCNNNSNGIYLSSSSNNTVIGNTCIRGTGLATDYTASQYTIQLDGGGNNYNLIAINNCMGKAVTNEGGTGNSVYGNKFDNNALVDSDIAVSPDVATAFGLTGNAQVKDVLNAILRRQIIVTTDSGSTVTATSDGKTVTGMATDGTCTLNIPAFGTWTVTATLSSDTKSADVVVDQVKLYTTSLPYIRDVFSANTWATIISACQSGSVPETWVVGNQKAMTINSVSYTVTIIGKGHDSYTGGGTAPLTFQLQDCYGTKNQMNGTDTNSGGWASCAMRTTHLPAILALMPSEVQTGIKAVDKLTSAGSKSSTINTSSDKLFLLSEIEIFDSITHSKSGEGSQYAYYSAGNSRGKNFAGSTNTWWERSPYGSNSVNFCHVGSSSNNASHYSASYSDGVAFGFCF